MTDLVHALIASFYPDTLLFIIGGSAIGLLFGIIPGLQNVTALSILLPFTYALAPTQALVLMVTIYSAGVYGCFITAILYRIPGAPENAATCFGGHPMALRGQGAKALGTAMFASGFENGIAHVRKHATNTQFVIRI